MKRKDNKNEVFMKDVMSAFDRMFKLYKLQIEAPQKGVVKISFRNPVDGSEMGIEHSGVFGIEKSLSNVE